MDRSDALILWSVDPSLHTVQCGSVCVCVERRGCVSVHACLCVRGMRTYVIQWESNNLHLLCRPAETKRGVIEVKAKQSMAEPNRQGGRAHFDRSKPPPLSLLVVFLVFLAFPPPFADIPLVHSSFPASLASRLRLLDIHWE